MLKDMNDPSYHTFRLSYWDWTKDNRADVFTRDKLGAHDAMTAEVNGELFRNWSNTICWFGIENFTACDPRLPTGRLLRCPHRENNDPCRSPFNWPTIEHVRKALDLDQYDTPDYTIMAEGSFRNYMEGFEIERGECEGTSLCFGKGSVTGKFLNRGKPISTLSSDT